MARDEVFAAHYNARVRAMKSALLTRQQFDDLLNQDDLSLLIEVLLNSTYEKDMAEALARFKGADAVEEALSRNMAFTFRRLLKCAQGEFAELAHIFFARWDLAAVKALLRARHHNLDPQRAAGALSPGPTMTPAVLAELAKREDMDTLVRDLAAWRPALCGCLTRELPRYRNEGTTVVFEDAMDESYFVQAALPLTRSGEEDRQFVGRFLQMEIDRINLRTVFQHRGAAGVPRDVIGRLLHGGTIRHQRLLDMANSRDVVEAMEFLGPTKYSELVEGLYQYLQTRRFAPLERMFEMLLVGELKRMARIHVMSIAVMMYYVWLKYNEVSNLRLIARGEARHLPRGRVREEMLYA